MPTRKRDNWMKKRNVEVLEPIERYYIFCDGEQTEPNYFEGFKKSIEQNPIYKNKIHINIEGLGKETKRVICDAQKHIQDNKVKNAQVWCVYDKDSFPESDFNDVSEIARNLTDANHSYNVAWSNQCIEYWFILHFDYYQSNNDRKDYCKYLHTKFKKFGLQRYKKNNPELFNILHTHGNPKQAISNAKKQIAIFEGQTDASSAPATKVHLLVEELSKYLPSTLKSKFLDK